MPENEDNGDYGFIYPAGDGPTGSSIDLVFDQIVARIEPITRFDRRSLSRQGAMERVASGVARLRSDIAISAQSRSGTGNLPGGLVVVSGASALGSEAQKALNDAWTQLPGRIDRWLVHYGNSDQELTPGDCFDGPDTFGYQYECTSCRGEGQTRCTSCSGAGENKCAACSGDGEERCFSCGGQGSGQCDTCGGRGTHMVQMQRQVFNSGTNTYTTEYYNENQRCSSCAGDGKIQCYNCGGRGRKTCSTCFGSGKQRCSSCNGSGYKRCAPCNGTGQRHEIQQITCTVTHRFQVALQDLSDEVQARLSRLSLAELASIGTIAMEPPGRARDFVERRYKFQVDIAELTVGVGAREVVVTGFGKEAVVHDFKNIAGLLLQADLEQLKTQAQKEPGVSLKASPPLRAAIQQCLDSEANVTVGNVPSNNPGALKALIGKQFAGALSLEYAQGLTTNLRTALGKLYFPAMFYPAATIAVLPAVLFLLGQLTEAGAKYAEGVAAGALLLSAVVWIVVERAVRKGFASAFGPGKTDMVDQLLRAQGVVARWRMIGGLVGVGLLIAAGLATRP